MRENANKLLEGYGVRWRFPTKDKKTRAKSPQGNCARTLHCSPELIVIVSLMKIFYPGTYAEHEKLLGHLEQAAAHADCQLPIGNEAPGDALNEASHTAPAALHQKKRKRRECEPELRGVRGESVTADDVASYAAQRRGQGTGSGATGGAGKGSTEAARLALANEAAQGGGSSPQPREGHVQGEVAEGEDEAEAEVDCSSGDLMEQLELDEDAPIGGVETAIAVWLTSMWHLTDVYTVIEDPFDKAQIEAYGEQGQKSGASWYKALQKHTCNRANWQYPHDSACHFKEAAIRLKCEEACRDDTLLEKQNRRQKRVGDRIIFK